MSGFDSTQMLVGGNHTLFVGPVGTVMPTDLTTNPNAAFENVGFTSEDGATWSVGYETETRTSSQSLDPTLRIRTGRDTSLAVGLQQFNAVTVPLAFGGGEVIETATPGVYKYDAPDGDDIDFRSLILHVENAGKTGRLLIPKAMVVETDESAFTKSQEVVLALTFGVVASGIAKPWTILGDVEFFSITEEEEG